MSVISLSSTLGTPEDKPFAVSAPFNSDPQADIVLRSSDSFDFQMQKAILSFISPAFSDLVNSRDRRCGFTDVSHGILPYIQLLETGLVFDTLLRYCYPTLSNPTKGDAALLMSVLDAAEKYAMPQIALEIEASIQRQRLKDPRSLLLLYHRACNRQQEAEAQQYARDCLKLPCSTIVKYGQAKSPDDALPNLINYHQSVSRGIGEFICTFERVKSIRTNMWERCDTWCNIGISEEPKWWTQSLAFAVHRIYEHGPSSARILPLRKELQDLCERCARRVNMHWDKFESEFKKSVETRVNSVKLVVPWKSTNETPANNEVHDFDYVYSRVIVKKRQTSCY